MSVLLLSSALCVIILGAMFLWAYFEEKKAFNKGVCPCCGTKLKFIADNPQVGKLYQCPKCKYKVWIYYFK